LDEGGNIKKDVLEQQQRALEQYSKKKTSPKAKPASPPSAAAAGGVRRPAPHGNDEERIPESPPKRKLPWMGGHRNGQQSRDEGDDIVSSDTDGNPRKVNTEAPQTPNKTPTKKGEEKTPMTPEEEEEKRKKRAEAFVSYKIREQKRQNAINPGSKDIPEGEPLCLQGLKFVFTGDLEALSRDDAMDLVRKYGGRDIFSFFLFLFLFF
jgi:replication factor C subunit 1